MRSKIIFCFATAISVAAASCAAPCASDTTAELSPTIIDASSAVPEPSGEAASDTTEPTECGGMCNPHACPPGTYFSGPITCQCVKPAKWASLVGDSCAAACSMECATGAPASECSFCISACAGSP